MKVEILLVSWWEKIGKKVERKGVSAYPVSLKDVDYNGVSRRERSEKGGRESDKERILKSMVVQSQENVI